MRPRLALLALLAGCDSSPAPPGDGAVELFVDSRAGEGGSGDAEAPFRTIGDALDRARALRAGGATGVIYLSLAPATFDDEKLPLVLDVPGLTLRSSGGRGLLAARSSAPDRAVLAVIADGVQIDGLTLYPAATDTGIYIDRAHGFRVEDVEIAGADFAIFARLSDGTIANCLLHDNSIGSVVAAGEAAIGHDADVSYERNVVVDNCIGGAFFLSTPRFDLPAPLGADGERILDDPPRGPGALKVTLRRNVIAMNKASCQAAGVQFFLHVGDIVDVEGAIDATVEDNDIVDNGGHELAVDAHHANRADGPCPVTAPARFHGDFSGNTFADPGKVFFGFGFRFPDGTCTVNDSTIEVTYADGELDGFAYDNPAGFGNSLVVNGTPLPATAR